MAKLKHIYSTGVIDDRHLQSSKYFYNTGHILFGQFLSYKENEVLWTQAWYLRFYKIERKPEGKSFNF